MEYFYKSLRTYGIYLHEREDNIIWTWNTSNGILSSKLAYESIISISHNILDNWWYIIVWKWNLPLKLKLLCWLMLENKIHRVDNYMKHGGMGPNSCMLCC